VFNPDWNLVMNDRIKELAEEAEMAANKGDHVDVKIMMAKFAELIVRECVSICQDVDGEDNIDARSGRQDCAVEIREHFGVEE
jgi:hypothetical protein